MPSHAPPPPLVASALGLGLEAFIAVRAAVGAGVADARTSFELVLTPPSSHWEFLVLAGIEPLVDALERLKLRIDELDWLQAASAIDAATRRRLADARFACDVDAIPEGTVVFPGEAVLAVEGPFWQAQLVGGMVQAAITDATLVATRFARLAIASGVDVVERGAASAHRLGGVPTLARAAYIGGAGATTNALAARRYGIPVTSTQPVRLDVALGSEESAIRAWLGACREGCILRLDAARADVVLPRLVAAVRERLRGPGTDRNRVAVELPSGDRAGLAHRVTRAFAASGLAPPAILVSGDVDEQMLLELRAEGCPIRGVSAPAEGTQGVSELSQYDLVAIEEEGAWEARLRVGPTAAQSSDPGRKLLVRYTDADGCPVADVAHAPGERLLRASGGRFVDRSTGVTARLNATGSSPLRAPLMRAGKRVSPPEQPSAIRERALREIQRLDEGHRRLVEPTRYPFGHTPQLANLKLDLLAKAAGDA
jgi:nicotinate phosphoribosyltransferase